MIVVRGDDGEDRGLVNVCRHRGSRVCLAPRGKARWFACPYHGWTYDLAGRLVASRQMLGNFDRSAHGLAAVHATLFHGFILISFADQPASLDGARRLLDPVLAPFGLARAKVAHSESYMIEGNWKLVIENYIECYHCAPAHPEFAASHSIERRGARGTKLMDALRERAREAGVSTEDIDRNGRAADESGFQSAYDRYPLYPGYVTGSEDGAPLAPLMGDIGAYDGGASDLQLGVFSYILFYSDHGVVYRFTPRGVQSTECEIV